MLAAWLDLWATLVSVLPWLVFLVALLVLLSLPLLSKSRRRRRLLRVLEEQRGSRVIAMIHRGRGPLRLFTGGGSIGLDEAETILKILRSTPPERSIDLILHTPGGLVLAAAQIARALQLHPATVRVIVPHWAMSGGTFLALAADEIIMDRNAVLGPVDPQTIRFPNLLALASVRRVIQEKSKDEIDDETWMLADQAEKAIRQIEDQITALQRERLGEEAARVLARTLTEGRWTHDYPLTSDALQALGLQVSTEVPAAVYDLLEALPSGGRFNPVQWRKEK